MPKTDTFYNFSSECEKCGETINPVENLYLGDTGVCSSCRNKEFSKSLKNGLV